MAKSTYSGGAEGTMGSYKFIKDPYLKEFRFRLANEEAIAKRRLQLEQDISKSTKASLEADHKERLKALEKEYDKELVKCDGNEEKKLSAHKRYLEKKNALDTQYNKSLEDNQEKIEEEKLKFETEANQFGIQLAEIRYKRLTVNQKAYYKKEELHQQKSHLQELNNDKQEMIAQANLLKTRERQLHVAWENAASEEERKEIESQINVTTAAREKLTEGIRNTSKDINSLQSAITNTEQERAHLQDLQIASQLTFLSQKEREQVIQDQIAEEEAKQAELRQQMADLDAKYREEHGGQEGISEADPEMMKLMSELNESAERVYKSQEMLAKANKEDAKSRGKKIAEDKKLAAKNRTADAAAEKAAAEELYNDPEYFKAEMEAYKAEKEAAKAQSKVDSRLQAEKDIADLPDKLNDAFKGFIGDLQNAVEGNTKEFYQYQAQITARLQGSGDDYKDIAKTIKKSVGVSGIVSQKEVVNNIKQLTESGVAYNLELRAFLATTKDRIAETFDVFNGNLLRIIRIQQADTTAARLGMEASLTKLFNQYFSDTSYLKDMSDSVSEALLDASAQMTRDQSMEFEYIVQKWLGALYSIGLSQDAVNTIAQGINYLGTGDIEGLNGNDQIRTLFAMSASQAGQDFGQLLLDGLDAESTNILMKSMVEYLADIAANVSTNKVTKSVYADLFGISTPDLTVINNLSDSVNNLYKHSLTYKDSMNEVQHQLGQVITRMHISQIMDTAFENLTMDFATNIGGNGAIYGLWKVLNLVEGMTGGIHIPAFSVMGNMVDLSQFTIEGLGKTAMTGLSLMGTLLNGMMSGGIFAGLNLDKWGFEEYLSRGKSITAISSGMSSGTSESSQLLGVGNSSAEDIKSSNLTDATDQAEEDSKITNKDVQENIDVYTQIRDALYKDENTTALTELQSIRKRLDDPFITSGSGGGGGGTSTGVGTSTGNATNVTSGGNELLPITENLTDILTTIQGIRGRLDTPFAISNPSVIVQDPTSTGGFTVIQQEPSTVNQELLTQIRDSVTDGGTSTLIKELQGIRGRLDEPFGTQLVTTQNSISDLIEQTHINSSTIKDMLTNDSFKSLINTSNSSNNEINTNNTIDQTIDAMGVLLSLLSLNRVFKVEFDDSKGTINNQTSSSTSTESTNSNINSTTYIEAIANHTNVISQLTTAVHDLNSSIVSTISEEFKNTQLVDNISSLQSQVSAISSTLGISNIQGTNAKNDVYLNGMADDVKSSLATSIAAALTNILTKSVEQGHSISIADIQNMLSLMNLNVTVTNDYFSDVLRKEAFNN